MTDNKQDVAWFYGTVAIVVVVFGAATIATTHIRSRAVVSLAQASTICLSYDGNRWDAERMVCTSPTEGSGR